VQYAGLEALYRNLKDEGFAVLGFPANQFGNQEPGTNEEIKAFCIGKFDVTFPLFAKTVVKGEGLCPLYKWLVGSTEGKNIEWNFVKFVIGRDGFVRKRFGPMTKPEDPELREAIEAALAVKPQ